MRAIVTQLTLFLRFPRYTIDIIVLPNTGMHLECEVNSMYKHRNQALGRPVTLSANSSLWLMPAMIIFILARALRQNVNDDKLTKSKPTLQAPHLRRSLSKNRSGAFRVEKSISLKLCSGIYLIHLGFCKYSKIIIFYAKIALALKR